MEWSEAETVFAEVTQLWDDWKPNDANTKLWMETLCGLASSNWALRSVRAHKIESAWKTPTLAKLLQHYYARSDGTVKRPEHVMHNTGVFVQCISRDGGRAPGHFRQLIYVTDLPHPNQIEQDAEAMRLRHANTYGGVWEIVRATNYNAMMDRMRELRFMPAERPGEHADTPAE